MSNVYKLTNGKTLADVSAAINHYLKTSENMCSQVLADESGAYLVQGRVNGGSYKMLVGMDKTVNVVLTPLGDSFLLDFKRGKWVDKAVGVALGWIVAWPLIFTSAYGAYRQDALTGKIQKFVEQFLYC